MLQKLDDEDMSIGSSLQGEVDESYKDMVRWFGEPNAEGDEYKIDVIWKFIEPLTGKIITIYNYKDGKNYLGDNGLPIEEIREWHIGGFDKTSYLIILLLITIYKLRDEINE